MKKTSRNSFLMLALTVAGCLGRFAAPAEIGKAAPDFTLTDIQGKSISLSGHRGKIVVLEWVNPECPFVMKHYKSGNIPTLQKNAAAEGMVWITINSARPGAQGDYAVPQVTAWSQKNGAAPSAYCRDSDGKVGRLYGAKTTPHMYVIAADGTLAYAGAIDSIRSANQADIAKATNYVTAALDALKAGKPVAKSISQPYGCSVKY
ncbi:MAG: redoxin domain-containing protein [Opitutaceae bacterium]|jgi:hypothetical protein|nr:redoxin domain-containing protein [Opitutaceae bacterium]